MPQLSEKDKNCIELIYQEKGWGAKKIVKNFPGKNWKVSAVHRLLLKIRINQSTKRLIGSGRPRTVRTQQNIAAVNELISSQEDQPRSHKSLREIEKTTGINYSSVARIAKKDLNKRVFKRGNGRALTEQEKRKRLERSRVLLDRFTPAKVRTTFLLMKKSLLFSPQKLILKMTDYIEALIKRTKFL